MKKFNSILLIDDDEVNNFINKLLLKKIGIADEIHVVTSGRSALDFLNKADKLKSQYPDLILLDINMPSMDGFEFLERFQKNVHFKKPTIVALTTSNIENDIVKMKNLGVENYLNKPLEEANLYSLFTTLAAAS